VVPFNSQKLRRCCR